LRSWLVAAVACVAVAACAPSRNVAPESSSGSGPARVDRPLSIVLRGEPLDLTSTGSGRSAITNAMFNAPLVGLDRGVPYPVLSTIPELNTDTWKVLPDGHMETTYRLKPGLAWHDGEALTAEDFVFGQRLNAARAELGLTTGGSAAALPEAKAIESVTALEPNVVVIRWRQPYADAANPQLMPLPRHILETTLATALEQGRGELLGSHAYWTTELVGLGPYQLTRWERGAYLEGAAFDRYALGRPNIGKITVTWSTDPNVTFARLLAGDADLALDEAIDFQQGAALRREWNNTGNGVVILAPVQNRYLGAQARPVFANPKSILDVRVRQASIHAIDRHALADALLEGEGVVAENFALPGEPFYEALDRVVAKYPYDPRRTDDLMREAGFTKGSDGLYASADEGRFAPEVLGIAEGVEGREATIISDYFRQAGIDAQLRLVPSVKMQADDELKSTYPSWRGNQAMLPARLATSGISAPENRWSGVNKTGYSNPEHDRLYDLWTRALDRNDRNDLQVQLYKSMNDNLPGLPLYFNFWVIGHRAELEGPRARVPGTDPLYGNVHEWHWLR
jgi:peptide/nickel transport system substrate-binding protein